MNDRTQPGLGMLGAVPCVNERLRQIAEAQAKGGCVPASTCHTGAFTAHYPEVCYPSPAEKEAVINDIKAAEIEAAILEEVVEEASKPESNAPEAEQRVADTAGQVAAATEALRLAYDTYGAEAARATVMKAWLTARRDQLRVDRDNLNALRRSLGIQ